MHRDVYHIQVPGLQFTNIYKDLKYLFASNLVTNFVLRVPVGSEFHLISSWIS